jgi:hypothetical protein
MTDNGLSRKRDRARGPIDIKVERVCAIESVTNYEAWQVLVDWFTSPYWHGPTDLAEMLLTSKLEQTAVGDCDFRLAESPSSSAISEIAQSCNEIDDQVPLSLVDRFVFGDGALGGAYLVAESVCHGERDAVVIVLDSGHRVAASLAAATAWIIAASIRHGFPEEVTHGYKSLMSGFFSIDDRSASTDDAAAVPLAALLPLPGGVAERSRIGDRDLAVPLPAYPLVAMLIPEHSALMFPTYDALPTLLADSSLGGRRGMLRPLGRWEVWGIELKFAVESRFAGPVSSFAGKIARGLARSRDRVAVSRVGPIFVPSGATLGWVWSLLRRASSVGRNPWLTRSTRSELDQSAVVEAWQ